MPLSDSTLAMNTSSIRVTESRSGLDVRFNLLPAQAPENCAFLLEFLSEPRTMPAIHAIWTGPEISCPIPTGMISSELNQALPPENATLTPQAGDLVLAYVPARMWGGSPAPIFDLGLFYSHGGRMLFPIGWLAGSVIARVTPEDLQALASGCAKIRQNGSCELTFERC